MKELRFFKSIVFVLLLTRTAPAASSGPAAPKHVRGQQQDIQAVRITWEETAGRVGYNLYASYDAHPPDFHKENEQPLKQNFVIWDAPREGSRKFLFYLTTVDDQGRESAPSRRVRVELKSRR